MHLGMSSSASPGSSGSAGQEPGRPSIPAPTSGRISSENGNQKILKENSENRVYANPPAGVKDVNLAAARDFTLNLPAGTSSNGAARVLGSWADCIEDLSPGAEDDFTVVKTKKRRRESSNSPTAAAPSSNSGGARSSRRLHSSARSVPRAQEIPTTRTHITEARARQASSSEEHCVYLEHGPELQPFHYLRALDRLLGGTADIIQISKVNGHQLLGLANRGLAERLINNGLEVEGTLLRAFPFRKRAERITVSNLPFFVEDSAIINALRPFGRITSIAPKMMKAGPYTYTDGRREAFIVLHEGMTTERLPTRLDITIKGEAWPAYLSTGIKCSRCHGQGHRRANCPLLAGLANNTRTAPPTTPAGVPPPTTPAPPQRSAAQPPAPTPSNPAMEVCSAPPVARAALHSSAPRPSPPAAPAFPMEETPPAPPPVTPAPSLQTPGSREPAAPTPDVEMSIVEETLASFTSSAKNATRVDLDAFIEGHPSVSFAKTDSLGLGREEVLDLLSSRTKAQRKGPLLSPPQCDALVGLIGQILDLRPGAASNLYKVLGQVKAELRTTPAVPPTPTLPAPRPARPTAPAPQVKESTPAMATPPPPPSVCMEDDSEPDYWTDMVDSVDELMRSPGSEPILQTFGACEFVDAARYPEVRECVVADLSPRQKKIVAQFLDKLIERTRDSVPLIRRGLSEFRAALPSYCKYTTCLHSAVRPRVARAPEFFASGGRKVSRMATNMVWAESPSKAEQKPAGHGEKAQPCAELSKKEDLQKKSSNLFGKSQGYANPPAGGHHANPATPTDFVTASFSEAAAQANRSWADLAEDNNQESENPFITVQRKKRRRGSAESPAAAAPSSNIRGAGAIRRPRSSTGWAPRAEEVRTTRAHIAEARARQASSTEDHCVYIVRSPELEPYHYMRALDRMLGRTREVFQMTKMNGHFLVGLANRGLAERLVNEGLEVKGTLHRAFPFRKRAERITVGNLPFFVGDAAVISALSSFGRVTSIAPKLMKAGPYVYNDGRREAFIILREGMTIERLPTRLDISIKGEAWPAYLSSGIMCSRCRGQGHRRANCPMIAGRTTAPGPATQTSPTSVPPATAPRLPQQPSARPPPPASPSSTMEVSDVPPASRAAPLPPAALQPSPPAPSALPLEDTPPAPPPVTPAPSLRTPGSREPAAPTPDVEMSIVEETFASSMSSAKNATRVDLDAFIEELPSVSFAKTDALGLGREEVLDLLSSRTKAQRKGPLLSPPQCDALVGLIGQILDLKPGHTSNLYKVLGQVRAELTKTPAAAPTPPLPAPRPDGPIPPPPHGDTTTPDMATSPSPLSTQMDRALMDKRWEALRDLMNQLDREFELDLEHRFQSRVDVDDILRAILYPGDREPLIKRLPTRDRYTLGGLMSTAIRRARELDPSILEFCRLSKMTIKYCLIVKLSHVYTCSTRPWWVVTACTVSTPHVYTCSTRPCWVVTACTVSTPHVYTRPCGHTSRELLSFSPLASGGMSLEATNLVWAESPHRAEHEPARLSSESEAVADLSAENILQGENSRMADASANYANLPIDRSHANFAAACIADVTPSTSGALAAATNWAEQMEAAESGEDSFTVVKHKRRRRESPNRPVEQRFSGIATSGRTGANPRSLPPAGRDTEVQVIRATRADIADARARQRSSTEDNCVFVEHCPDFGSTHYLQAVEELVGGAGNVLQVMKMDGHMLVGLSTKALAERIIRDGLDIGHTHLRAFPFKKRAERITVGNLPFFVDDAAVIEALKPYGNVTSIVPIRLRAGRYTFTDGRREAFILLKEGIALEKIPTRVVIRNKGNVLPAFISYGVKCSRCGRQGHRRANCPINPRRASNDGQPQPATHPPRASSTVSRQPNPPTPAAPALPMEETPSAPPPVIPAPSLQAPEGPIGPCSANSHPEPPPARPDFVAPHDPLPAQKTLGPAAPTPDVEMYIVEETSAFSTSSAKNATRFDLDAFIERHPTVSFAGTDALGLGREEVLDLLSSRTKAQRNGPLLSPPQCDALAGLIRQILDLRPGAATNLYKVLGQVKAELRTRTTPAAVPPSPPLPAPRPSEPVPLTSHGKQLSPASRTPPLPAPTEMEEGVPITEEERCAPPPPAPRLAGPIPPVPHGDTTTPPTPLGKETTLAMTAPPPPLSDQLIKADLDRECLGQIRDLLEELNYQHALRPLIKKGIDLDNIAFAI
ncbi:hypothetical protein LAZ67_6002966, partial [Cordylochernes scorpioides]